MKEKDNRIAVSPFEFAIMCYADKKASETHREFTVSEMQEQRERKINEFMSKIKHKQ